MVTDILVKEVKMRIIPDYHQIKLGVWNVFIDKGDNSVSFWFNTKTEEGDVVPVEARMTPEAAIKLSGYLQDAVKMLNKK